MESVHPRDVPTVFREDGWRGFFYGNEGNEPPHIHLGKGDGEAKFWLGPVRLAESAGLKERDLSKAEALVAKHESEILERWAEYFGN